MRGPEMGPGNGTFMQSQLTLEELLHFIPLAIGYAIILILFLKSRRDVKRSRSRAAEVVASEAYALEERAIREGLLRKQAAAAAEAAAQRSQLLAERAELLRTYRRAESSQRIAAALASGQRR